MEVFDYFEIRFINCIRIKIIMFILIVYDIDKL